MLTLHLPQWTGHGINLPGGFAEYCAYPQGKVFKIENLTDIEATLIEPASCAAHGLDKIRPRLGSSVLMFGAGPTGLVSSPSPPSHHPMVIFNPPFVPETQMLAQLLRQNGCSQVTIAAPGGLKMNLARELDAADHYIELSRANPVPQFEQIKKDNPHGFDIVVEATGSVKILEDAINYCRRGGTLVVYGYVLTSSSWHPPCTG
jgi:D-arabinitol dehydrogenase (NADP+)